MKSLKEQLCNFYDVIVVISQGIGQMPKFATSEWWTMTKRQGQDSSSGTSGGFGYRKEHKPLQSNMSSSKPQTDSQLLFRHGIMCHLWKRT